MLAGYLPPVAFSTRFFIALNDVQPLQSISSPDIRRTLVVFGVSGVAMARGKGGMDYGWEDGASAAQLSRAVVVGARLFPRASRNGRLCHFAAPPNRMRNRHQTVRRPPRPAPRHKCATPVPTFH